MTLFRWQQGGPDLFTQLERLQREMNGMLSNLRPGTEPTWRMSSAYPPVNVYNDGESYIVQAEVPGVDPKSLDIEVTGDTLTIRGERKEPGIPESAAYHRREREFGRFRRSLTLPEQVDNNKVMANCNNGILDIRLPFAEQAKRRKITVKAN